MFDPGFTELVLLLVIGLLILGPERLPRVASQLGRWVSRARRTANQLRHQLEREVALDEMTRSQRKSTHARGSAASSARPGEPDPGAGPAAAGTEAPGEPDPAAGTEAPREPDPGAGPARAGEEAPAAADSGAGEAAPASAPGEKAGGPARDEAGAAPAADDAAGPDADGAGRPDRSSQA